MAMGCDGFPTTVGLRESPSTNIVYNVTFDLGDVPHDIELQGLYKEKLLISIDGPGRYDPSNFSETAPMEEHVYGIAIFISFSDHMSTPGPNGGIGWSGSYKGLKERGLVTSPPSLDNLEAPMPFDEVYKNPGISVYKNITIDGKDGRLMTNDPSSGIRAIFYVDPVTNPGVYAVIIAGFVGDVKVSSNIRDATTEEIQFKVSYMENFLKSLHIERREDLFKSSPAQVPS